jgi:anti-anti-sigma regulatory factor
MEFRAKDGTSLGQCVQVKTCCNPERRTSPTIRLSKFRGHDNSWPRTTAQAPIQLRSMRICNVLGARADWCASCLGQSVLRITTIEMESGIKELQLSGSISDAWVQELQECCETWLAAGNAVTLDLKEVQYADYAGLELISRLKSRNVTLVRTTSLVARLLEVHEAQRTE